MKKLILILFIALNALKAFSVDGTIIDLPALTGLKLTDRTTTTISVAWNAYLPQGYSLENYYVFCNGNLYSTKNTTYKVEYLTPITNYPIEVWAKYTKGSDQQWHATERAIISVYTLHIPGQLKISGRFDLICPGSTSYKTVTAAGTTGATSIKWEVTNTLHINSESGPKTLTTSSPVNIFADYPTGNRGEGIVRLTVSFLDGTSEKDSLITWINIPPMAVLDNFAINVGHGQVRIELKPVTYNGYNNLPATTGKVQHWKWSFENTSVKLLFRSFSGNITQSGAPLKTYPTENDGDLGVFLDSNLAPEGNYKIYYQSYNSCGYSERLSKDVTVDY